MIIYVNEYPEAGLTASISVLAATAGPIVCSRGQWIAARPHGAPLYH